MIRICLAAAGVVILAAGGYQVLAQHHEHGAATQSTAAKAILSTPEAMRIEHRHLHEQLDEAMAAGGKTAEAAKQVQAALAPHFVEEEAYAMPPLSLLPMLAQRQQPTQEQVHAAIDMSDKLRTNYKQMLAEHQEIVKALAGLAKAANEENRPQAAKFAEDLTLHAQNEEQVLYPATLVLGDYLKLKSANVHP